MGDPSANPFHGSEEVAAMAVDPEHMASAQVSSPGTSSIFGLCIHGPSETPVFRDRARGLARRDAAARH